jgi:uncharacterized protein YfeS
MKPPIEFYLMARAYNSYGGHLTLSLIPGFLLTDTPDFGKAISELTVTFHFPTRGPARKTLEQHYANFHANRLQLPKVVFYRSREKASVDVASDLLDGSDLEGRRGLSLPLFATAVKETVAALRLLKTRLTAKDDFSLDALLTHCERRETSLPTTDEALAELKTALDQKRAAIRAAMSPWERLDIDWRDYHPNARRMLDDPFFWEGANDFSPHGNDTGADLLSDYRSWLKRNPTGEPLDFYRNLITQWGFSLDSPDSTARSVMDEAAIALAFAEFKLRGECRPKVSEFARQAADRQRQEALQAVDWPHREDRLKSLNLIQAKLRAGS